MDEVHRLKLNAQPKTKIKCSIWSNGLIDQCVILLDGRGGRLGDVGKATPKPLLEVYGTPFVELLIAEARRRGFSRFVLSSGYSSERLEAFLREREIERRFDCRVELSIGPTPCSAGDALVNALPLLAEEFLLLNGDTWFDFNWRDLVARAWRDGAPAAVSLRHIDRADLYEPIERNGEMVAQITCGHEPETATIYGGVYYLTRRALEGLACPSSLEMDLLPSLAGRGSMYTYDYEGFFIDIGLQERLPAAETLILRQRRRPAVFFDRDGVLNVDHGYAHRPEQIEWVEGAREAVKSFNDAGFFVFVVTNQAGVAKGLYDEADIVLLHGWMAEQLAQIGATVDDWRYCPYHPEGSISAYRQAHNWRKPGSGMIDDLFLHWPVERQRSFLIGDKDSDVKAAEAAGIPGFLFRGGALTAFVDKMGLRPDRRPKPLAETAKET